MIRIEELKEEDKGRKVIYGSKSPHTNTKLEEGIISSWNDYYIFVKYNGETTSKATSPQDLIFLTDTK